MSSKKVFCNGRILQYDYKTKTAKSFDALVTDGPTIQHVGVDTDTEVQEAKDKGAEIVDLEGRYLLPGFIDSHVHLLEFGHAIDELTPKLDLSGCRGVEAVKTAVRDYAKTHTEMLQILCKNWPQSSMRGDEALASTLDNLDERPIFIEAADSHSSWCNTPAMYKLELDEMMKKWPPSNDPKRPNHHIQYDKDGKPSGLFSESANIDYVHGYVASSYSDEATQQLLGTAFEEYQKAGYTGIVGMYTKEYEWNALQKYMSDYKQKHGDYPVHMGVYWAVDDETKIEAAINMHKEYHRDKNRELCVLGMKIISDGVVDGRTASLSRPYPHPCEEEADPIWPLNALKDVVKRADKEKVQCAIHAIGDNAIKQAVDVIGADHQPNSDRRHRIEHLEVAGAKETERLGQLGIIASIQPVASDPEGLHSYERLLGTDMWNRVFPFREMLDAGARLAIGSDAPTAPHHALPSLYIATTRRSAWKPETDQKTPGEPIPVPEAVAAATTGSAYARFAETWTGSLQPGLQADLVVLDTELTPEGLLKVDPIYQTWYKGRKVYEKAGTGGRARQVSIGEQVAMARAVSHPVCP